jgi:hypothetical protein
LKRGQAANTGTVREAPCVHDLALHVEEVDGAVSGHGREQRVALERAVGVVGDEPGTRAPDALLIDGGHELPPNRKNTMG